MSAALSFDPRTVKAGDVLFREPGFSHRKHRAEARRSPLWRRVSICITVKHLERLDALRTSCLDRVDILDYALTYAFAQLDRMRAREAKRDAAKKGGAR
jgi:hypothetical protein